METYPDAIFTNRFLLRPLTLDDVSDRYASWFNEPAIGQYISAAASKPDLDTLRQYVLERSGRDDVIFLGIFEKITGLHIGNIKYEPVDSELGYAIMGVLIGESCWRGKGAVAEVLLASAEWLSLYRNIRQIVLGVSRSNTAAILAYRKVGFIEESTEFIPVVSMENMTMVFHLKPTAIAL